MKKLTIDQAGKLFRYNIDYFSLASTPHEEKCMQAGENPSASILECKALKDQLIRIYGKQEGTEFFIVANDHDFGRYYELGIMYKQPPEPGEGATEEDWDKYDENPALEYAQKLESGIPDKWDYEALQYLEANEHPYHILAKVIQMRAA